MDKSASDCSATSSSKGDEKVNSNSIGEDSWGKKLKKKNDNTHTHVRETRFHTVGNDTKKSSVRYTIFIYV